MGGRPPPSDSHAQHIIRIWHCTPNLLFAHPPLSLKCLCLVSPSRRLGFVSPVHTMPDRGWLRLHAPSPLHETLLLAPNLMPHHDSVEHLALLIRLLFWQRCVHFTRLAFLQFCSKALQMFGASAGHIVSSMHVSCDVLRQAIKYT